MMTYIKDILILKDNCQDPVYLSMIKSIWNIFKIKR